MLFSNTHNIGSWAQGSFKKEGSKKVPMTKFWFKKILMFCLTVPESGFNLVTQKLQKTESFPFQMLRTFVFDLKVILKQFSKKLPMNNFEFKWSWRLCLTFPENGFNFNTQKVEKNPEKCHFQKLKTFAFEIKVASNHFPKSFLWPNFNLNGLEDSALLSQKTVSTSSLKNLKRIVKCHF